MKKAALLSILSILLLSSSTTSLSMFSKIKIWWTKQPTKPITPFALNDTEKEDYDDDEEWEYVGVADNESSKNTTDKTTEFEVLDCEEEEGESSDTDDDRLHTEFDGGNFRPETTTLKEAAQQQKKKACNR